MSAISSRAPGLSLSLDIGSAEARELPSPGIGASPSSSLRDERALTALSFLWHFLTMAAIYLVMPVRSAFFNVNLGPDALPWAYMASAAATGIAVGAYGRFTHLPRKRLLSASLLFLSANLVAWWGAAFATGQSVPLSFAFYLWSDVFSIMATTLFWTFANGAFSPEAAKRRFGILASAGALGAIAGSFLLKALLPALGLSAMLPIAAGILAATVLVLLAAERYAGSSPRQAKANLSAKTGFLEAGRTILSSPLLRFLALLVALERMVPDFANYLFNVAAHAAYPGREDFAAFAATFSLWTNLLSLAAGALLTGVAFKRLGVGGALRSVALANLFGFLAFFLHPGLAVAAAFNGLEGLLRYSWFKSAKEASYSAAGQDAIRVKPFIEMFLYRFSRGVAGFGLLLLTAPWLLGVNTPVVALAAVPLALLWLYAARGLASELRPTSGLDNSMRTASEVRDIIGANPERLKGLRLNSTSHVGWSAVLRSDDHPFVIKKYRSPALRQASNAKTVAENELFIRQIFHHPLFASFFEGLLDTPRAVGYVRGWAFLKAVLVMEIAQGSEDTDKARTLPLDTRVALGLLAHTFGLLDLNPGNVLFPKAGGPVLLVDFEKARFPVDPISPNTQALQLILDEMLWLDRYQPNRLEDFLPEMRRWQELMARPETRAALEEMLGRVGVSPRRAKRQAQEFIDNAGRLEEVLRADMDYVNRYSLNQASESMLGSISREGIDGLTAQAVRALIGEEVSVSARLGRDQLTALTRSRPAGLSAADRENAARVLAGRGWTPDQIEQTLDHLHHWLAAIVKRAGLTAPGPAHE